MWIFVYEAKFLTRFTSKLYNFLSASTTSSEPADVLKLRLTQYDNLYNGLVQHVATGYLLILTDVINLSHPGKNGRHFADDIFKYISMNEKLCISIQFSLKSIPEGVIDNKSALVHVMAWRRAGDKLLPEPRLTWFTDAYMRHSGEMS